MLTDLQRYMAQRFPWKTGLMLAVILWQAVPWHRHYAISPGIGAVFCALLALRIADDLNSIAQDRLTNPERLLVRGAISVLHMRRWAAILALAALAMVLIWLALRLDVIDGERQLRWTWYLGVRFNQPDLRGSHLATLFGLPWWLDLLLLPGLILWYLGYFRYKADLPLVLRPFFSNWLFLVLPIIGCGQYLLMAIMLGLFCWLAAVGHEYAHNVRAIEERESVPAAAPDYVDSLGPLGTLALAALLYGLALASGLAYRALAVDSAPELAQRTQFFHGSMLLCGLMLVPLFWLAWVQPSRLHARRFYVPGFVFFLLPLLVDLVWDTLNSSLVVMTE